MSAVYKDPYGYTRKFVYSVALILSDDTNYSIISASIFGTPAAIWPDEVSRSD